MKSTLTVRSPRLGLMQRVVPLAFGLLSLAMISPAFGSEEEQMRRTVTVTGQGTESIATSRAEVQLGVEVQGKTAEEAQQEAARRSAAVVELLRSRNVDKLQTTGIYLSPRYDYNENRQSLIGYTATNTVSFRVPTDSAGPLLDEAVRAGATRIDSVSFVADDAAIATARQQAIREATADAQTQAEAALSALGLTRKDVVSIEISGGPPPMPLYRAAYGGDAREAAAAQTPVVGGEQEVQASVTLKISY